MISAEQDAIEGPGCCGPEALEALADALLEAEQLVNGEEVTETGAGRPFPCVSPYFHMAFIIFL